MADFTSDAERDAALRLVMARQHIAATAPLSMCPPWDELSEHEREMSLIEARNWLRAADNAGLTRRHEIPDASELRERLRLIALIMCGLDGYADACEDSGQHSDAAVIRESTAEVRGLLPDAADPTGIEFEWAVRFTSVTGREFTYPADCEGDALEIVLSVTAPESSRWALMRRVVGPYVEVPSGRH